MTSWRNRLEIRILLLSILLPLLGVSVVSTGALFYLKSGLTDVVRFHSEASPEIISKSVEKMMLTERPELVKPFIDSLNELGGIGRVSLMGFAEKEGTGRSEEEVEVAARLHRTPEPFVKQVAGELIFYQPLLNEPECRTCHVDQGTVLGATRVGIPLSEANQRVTSLVATMFFWALAGVAAMGVILWWVTKKLVVLPVQKMNRATASLAEGDLTVEVPITSRDEIGTLAQNFRESQRTLSSVIARINSVAARAADASSIVESESAEVVEATGIEADSFEKIASSMEELNASIRTIASSVEELSRSVKDGYESSSEMTMVTREIFKNIDDLSNSVTESTSTTGEMSHTIRELSWGASQLSAVSKETLTAVQSLEKFLAKVKEDASDSTRQSERVKTEAAELGAVSVKNTLHGMENIRDAFNKTSTFITSLGGMSKQIGEVVDVIDEVTDQTSLLALNAAILAAQAGKHGQGFEVVAAEIRKLANRSAKSTVQISKLISSVRENVSGAVDSMNDGLQSIESGFSYAREAGSALEKIVKGTGQSMEKAASISAATVEQSNTLATISNLMTKLDSMAKFLAKGTDEQKREAAFISETAEEVQQFVRQIKTAAENQLTSSQSIEQAMDSVSEGMAQISKALEDEQQGSSQIMASLVEVVDLPGRTRSKAAGINHGLRGIVKNMELLRTEVQRFKVISREDGGNLVLGVVPLESPADMHRRFTPLVEYLAARLGKKVELKVALDFTEAVQDVGEGRTHVAYMTPSTYVEAEAKYGVVLLAKALRDGKPFQHSKIVTTRKTGIQELGQLRGRSFAFGDPHSTSSHIVPRAMLEEAGVSLEKLGGHAYLDHHDDVARAVLKGEYEAGAVMESVAQRYAGEGLVVIATSPPIPEFNFCATAKLPVEKQANVKEALLNLSFESSEGKKVLSALAGGQTGFMTASREDYADIAEMMRRVSRDAEDDKQPPGAAEKLKKEKIGV